MPRLNAGSINESTNNRPSIQPLSKRGVRRIKNAKLVKVGAFKSVARNEKTGDTYDQIKLSLDWETGYFIEDVNGDPVLDKSGKPQPHYINEGFVTLTGSARGNLIKILDALGFADLFDEEGNLGSDVEMDMEFGKNGLGNTYTGLEFDDLPYYTPASQGGKEKKRDVEVPVIRWTLNGRSVLGRRVDLSIEEKGGYDRVKNYIEPEQANVDEVPARALEAAIEVVDDEKIPFDPNEPGIDEDPFVKPGPKGKAQAQAQARPAPAKPAPAPVSDSESELDEDKLLMVGALEHLFSEGGLEKSKWVPFARSVVRRNDFARLDQMSQDEIDLVRITAERITQVPSMSWEHYLK